MPKLETLRALFDHHYWARDRQLAACAALSAEDFSRPMGSSFPSIRDTLVHMVSVEWVWLERWQGRTPPVRSLATELPTFEAIAERWRAVERDLRGYLAGLSEETAAGSLTYTNFQGQVWTYPLMQVIMHVLLHQSMHRGQVTTLLRQLGATPPTVDLLVAYDMGFKG